MFTHALHLCLPNVASLFRYIITTSLQQLSVVKLNYRIIMWAISLPAAAVPFQPRSTFFGTAASHVDRKTVFAFCELIDQDHIRISFPTTSVSKHCWL